MLRMRSDGSSRPSPGAARWPAAFAADRRDQLGDVVAVAAGGDCRERDVVRLDHQVVLAAGPAPVHRARIGGRPAPHHADVAGVDRCAGEVQQVCGPQLGQQLVRCQTRPRSSPAAVASRSSPSRSPAPGAETPSGSRCTARTGPRTAPCDHPNAHDLNAADYAGRPAAAARSAPTSRRRSPTVWQRSTSSRPGRTPLGPATMRTDTPSFPQVPKPPFVRSRKRRHAPGPASPLRFSRAPSGRVLRPGGPETGPTCRAVPRPCRLTRASWHPLCGGPTGQDQVRNLPAHPGRHRSRDLRRPGRVPSP